MPADTDIFPVDTPAAVLHYAGLSGRTPIFDPTLGQRVDQPTSGTPRHRLVAIGDSLTHGVQSGAIHTTELSYPAIIAHELGWQGLRRPDYPGRGGLPLNIELILRDLEQRYGPTLNVWETPLALFRVRDLMDDIEDYWERGAGAAPPRPTREYMHTLAVYGWDIRDALDRTAADCAAAIGTPVDNITDQWIEHNQERAALRVYPTWPEAAHMTFFDVAAALGRDHHNDTDAGIETLVILLGSNNALQTVTKLKLRWTSGNGTTVGAPTMWDPDSFSRDLAQVVEKVSHIEARHVIWGTVPHVSIPPISRGIGSKVAPGSRYFPYYTRPWIDVSRFDPQIHQHLTAPEIRAIDYGVDMFNDAIQTVVERGRAAGHDWYLFDLAAVLDRLASRRYLEDPNARPRWWTPYTLPPDLAQLTPVPNSRFLTGDGHGGRASGGLFSLDGIHPSTIGYGLIAQELINIMRGAGVEFRRPDGTARPDPVTVDFARLVQRDTLLLHPPQNLTSTMEILGWADATLGVFKKVFQF